MNKRLSKKWDEPQTITARRGMLEAMGATQKGSRSEGMELIERARDGDRQAFDALIEEQLPAVWGVVWRVLRHQEDTEDVVQEVFIAAFKGLAGFRGESRFSTWLHRIAITRALNHLERAGERLRRSSTPIDEPEAGGLSEQALHAAGAFPHCDTPLEKLEAAELYQRLRECLPRLPGPWRAALMLRENQGLAYDELARVLSIAVGTVRSRLARARAALRECLEEGLP